MRRLALFPLLALAACCAAAPVAPVAPAAPEARKPWPRGGCEGFSYEVPPAFRKADAKTLGEMVRANVLPGLDGSESELWFAGPASAPKSAVVLQAHWDAGKTPEQISARVSLLASFPKELIAAGMGEELKSRGWELVSCSGAKPAKLGGLEGATASLSCKRGDGPETAVKNFFAASGNLTFTFAVVYRKDDAKQAAPALKRVLESIRVKPVPGLARAAKPAAPLTPLPVAAKGTRLVAEGDFEMLVSPELAAEQRPLPAGFREEPGAMRTRLAPGDFFALVESGKPQPAPGEIDLPRAWMSFRVEDMAPPSRFAPTEDFPFVSGVGRPEMQNVARTIFNNNMAAYREAGATIDPRLEQMGPISFDGAEARTAAGGVRVVRIVGTAVWLHLRPSRVFCYIVMNRDHSYTVWCTCPIEEEAKWEALFDGALGSIRPAAR